MLTDFSKAKINDKVFDRFQQEWGIIDSIFKNDCFGICVNFGAGKGYFFYMEDGRISNNHAIPALVWDMQKPEDDWSILPEMPKRIIKKTIEECINVYEWGISDFRETKEKTIEQRQKTI